MKKIILMLSLAFVGIQVFAQDATKEIAPQFEYTPTEEYMTIPAEKQTRPKVRALEKSQFEHRPTTKSETTAADAKPKKLTKAPQFEYTAPNKIVPRRTRPKAQEPTIQWRKMTHNFGTINYQKPVTGTFEFVNTGNAPVVIKEAKGSCGCTGTDFPKDAIMPGETARITATYDAENIGPFKKTVTVYTSADTVKEGTVLHITGEVIWKL